MFKLLPLFSLTILAPILVYSQSGPGGVGNNIDNEVWLDAYQQLLNDNDFVSTFSDASGNGNDFTAPANFRRPIFEATALNGMPGMVFDGNNDFLQSGSISDLETNTLTWFIVSSKVGSKQQNLLSSRYTSGSYFNWASYVNSTDDRVVNYFTPNTKFNKTTTGNVFHMLTNTVSTNQLQTRLNGTITNTKSGTFTAGSGHMRCRIGGGLTTANSYALNGTICEAIVYSRVLNSTELRLVHNYLSSKYALAIPVADDKYALEGTGHYYEVAGIGMDGGLSVIDAQGSGIVRMNGATALGNGDYILWGHDNASTGTTTTEVPAAYPAGGQKMIREWRVDITNTPGSINVIFDMTGIGFGGDPLSYSLLIDDDGDFSNGGTTIIPPTTVVGDIVTFVGVNFTDNYYFTIGNSTGIESVQDGPWNAPTTWNCSCVPANANNPTIKAGHTVTVDILPAETRDLYIEPTGVLAFDPGMQLNVYGNADIDGDIVGNGGILEFSGLSAQTIDMSGTANLGALTNNNSVGGVDITGGGDWVIHDSLFLEDGNLDITGAGSFTLRSNSSYTARVGTIINGSLTGALTMQRFIDGSDGAGYRDICSPLNGVNFADWDNDFIVSGNNFPDGCAFGGSCYHSIKSWNESAQTYADVTSPGATINNGEGYEVFIGETLTALSDTTMSVTGTINAGTVVVTVPAMGPELFDLVGNPFCSQINFDNIVRENTTFLGDYYYVYDPGTGNYEYYSQSVGGGNLTNIIASSQAFWIENSNTVNAYDLTFGQDVRTSSAAIFRSLVNSSNNHLSLVVSNITNNTQGSISVYQDGRSRNAIDPISEKLHIPFFDGPVKIAPRVWISDYDAVRDLSVREKTFALMEAPEHRLPVHILTYESGEFSLSALGADQFRDNYSFIYLKDLSNGKFYPIHDRTNISLELSESEEYRMELILRNEPINETISSIDANVIGLQSQIMITNNETEPVQIKIYTVSGQLVKSDLTLPPGGETASTRVASSGLYIIELSTPNKISSHKVFVR